MRRGGRGPRSSYAHWAVYRYGSDGDIRPAHDPSPKHVVCHCALGARNVIDLCACVLVWSRESAADYLQVQRRFSAGSATLRCAGCNPCGTIDRGPPHRYGTTRGPRPGRSTFVETSCSPLVSLSLWDVSVRCGGCETWCERQRETTEDGPIFEKLRQNLIFACYPAASLSETPHRVTDAPSDYGLKVPTATPGGRD